MAEATCAAVVCKAMLFALAGGLFLGWCVGLIQGVRRG